MIFDSMPPMSFRLVHTTLLKHFNQWWSPLRLPIDLPGDVIVVQAMARYICGHGSNANIPQSYYSAVNHYDINLPDLIILLTDLIKIPQDKVKQLD